MLYDKFGNYQLLISIACYDDVQAITMPFFGIKKYQKKKTVNKYNIDNANNKALFQCVMLKYIGQ